MTPAIEELVAQAATDEQFAVWFHNTYERLAPDFGYETRSDTKAFDSQSKNGKLMVAVCGQAAAAIRELAGERDKLDAYAGQQIARNLQIGDENEALQAEVTLFKADPLHSMLMMQSTHRLGVIHNLQGQLEAFRTELKQYIAKAKEYVRHKHGCAMYTPVDASTDCNCGLSEWLKVIGG